MDLGLNSNFHISPFLRTLEMTKQEAGDWSKGEGKTERHTPVISSDDNTYVEIEYF